MIRRAHRAPELTPSLALPTMQQLLVCWNANLPVDKIAKRFGVAKSVIYRLRDKYKLPAREKLPPQPRVVDPNRLRGTRPEYEPTPEEILEVTAEIRSGWSAEDYQQRYVGDSRPKWTVPSYAYNSRTGVFTP